MLRHMRWFVFVPVIATALLLTACGTATQSAKAAVEPAHVEPVEGTELSKVMLIDDAIKRLDIQTVAVHDEQVIRKRAIGGEVMELPDGVRSAVKAAAGAKIVRVALSESDLAAVDRAQGAMILPLVKTSTTAGVAAQPIEAAALGKADDATKAMYFLVDGAGQELKTGNRVRVEMTLAGSGAQRTVIPYSSIIYDLEGDTWVYTNPEPGAYVRELVVVDYIDGDKAILSQSLPASLSIVSVGAAELYGTEFGVGH